MQSKFVNKFTFSKKLLLTIPYLLLTIIFLVVPLIIILILSFRSNGTSVSDNFDVLTGFVWQKIGMSILISLATTIFCIVIAYPFTYFLSLSKSKTLKFLVMLLISAPIWLNMLVKLIGLKTMFDLMCGGINSSYGNIFTILGLTYLYIPFLIMPLYNSLELLPKNLINASKDLGRGQIYTFFKIVIPWTKNSLISGIVLIMLPALTSVAVPSFLNNSNNGSMIGNIIDSQGQSGLNNSIALSRTSVLALVISAVMFFMYSSIIFAPKLYSYIVRKVKNER